MNLSVLIVHKLIESPSPPAHACPLRASGHLAFSSSPYFDGSITQTANGLWPLRQSTSSSSLPSMYNRCNGQGLRNTTQVWYRIARFSRPKSHLSILGNGKAAAGFRTSAVLFLALSLPTSANRTRSRARRGEAIYVIQCRRLSIPRSK